MTIVLHDPMLEEKNTGSSCPWLWTDLAGAAKTHHQDHFNTARHDAWKKKSTDSGHPLDSLLMSSGDGGEKRKQIGVPRKPLHEASIAARRPTSRWRRCSPTLWKESNGE
jgi:hypothetical protein